MKTNTKRVPSWTTAQFAPESPLGVHIIADFWGAEVIESQERIERILLEAARLSNNTVLKTLVHKFDPQGLTGIVLLEESHISIHTWPEFSYVGVDIFTCGENSVPEKALEYLQEVFAPKSVQVSKVDRGSRWKRGS
ncbi:MAG: adenosylmethionine decarboxylase [bacterium]|nr:adenosylmethionine decarboxylase [bacterium]